MNSYHIKLNMIMVTLVIIGALNWGLTAFDYNILSILDTYIKNLSNINIPFAKTIYVIVAFAGIYLAVQRDTWLPFLGYNVIPVQLLVNRTPNNPTRKISVRVNPNETILYWAAKSKGDGTMVDKAYDDYSNSGLVKANDQGDAELPIVEGSGYTLPSGQHLDKHVHYRVVGLDNGMAGSIQTIYY